MKRIENYFISTAFLRALAVFVFILIIAARFLSVMTERSVPDADECIVGIMGIHVLEDRESPLYFYGQGYGAGAGFEARLCALFFSVFGVDGKAVKVTALILWTALALVAWSLARRMWGTRAAWFFMLLFSATPQMAEWSMKLRGGHLTSLIILMLAGHSSWSVLAGPKQRRPVAALLTGFLAAAAIWSQPVSVPASIAVIVFVLIFLVGWKRYFEAGLVMGGTVPVAIIFYLSSPENVVWPAPATDIANIGTNLLPLIMEIFPRSFTPYLDPIAFQPEIHVSLAALVWGLFLSAALALSLRYCYRKGPKDKSGRALLFFNVIVLICVASVLMVDPAALAPRHLLACCPFFCLLAAPLFLFSKNKNVIKGQIMVCGLLLISGITANASVLLDKNFHNPGLGVKIPAESVGQTVAHLQREGLTRVFSADTDFTWNLIFEGRENVIARSWNPRERYQPYVEKVNRAARAGAPVAVVVPFPEGPLKKPVIKDLLAMPGAKLVNVAPRVVVISGIPGKMLIEYFNTRFD